VHASKIAPYSTESLNDASARNTRASYYTSVRIHVRARYYVMGIVKNERQRSEANEPKRSRRSSRTCPAAIVFDDACAESS